MGRGSDKPKQRGGALQDLGKQLSAQIQKATAGLPYQLSAEESGIDMKDILPQTSQDQLALAYQLTTPQRGGKRRRRRSSKRKSRKGRKSRSNRRNSRRSR